MDVIQSAAATPHLFYGLPEVIWSGIIASVVSVLGAIVVTFATNRGSNSRAVKQLQHATDDRRLQLEHDSAEKARERLVSMRRELYLKAVDHTVRAIAYLGRLPKTDLTKHEADAPFQEMLAVGAQLQLVVNQETAEVVSDLISELSELHMRLLIKVMPMHNLQSEIKIYSEHYDNFVAESKRIQSALTQFRESGQRDQVVFDQLNRSLAFANEQSKVLADKRGTNWKQFMDLHRTFMKDMVPELKRIVEKQTTVLVQLRKELDVGGDNEFFQNIMSRQAERVRKAVEQFRRDVSGDRAS